MKKMKKVMALLMAASAAAGCVTTVGCATSSNAVKDEKTINVRLFKAGFGDKFIYDLEKAFEALYAEEGYKMNILTPSYDSNGTPMVQEMSRGYDKTQIDLYFTGGFSPNMVSDAGEYGEVCEDLEELVWNQTAINYDGTESEKTISQRLNSDLEPFLRADNGTLYMVPWAQTSAGMVVNTTKLAHYGITELPRTTNELFEVFEIILNGTTYTVAETGETVTVQGSSKTKTYPITYNLSKGKGGAAGYSVCAFESWVSQYGGIDAFNELYRMETKTEDGWVELEDAYNVFASDAIKESLEVAYQMMDMKYAATGSNTHDLDQAQALIMKDYTRKQTNAVFMCNGDWFLNEVKMNYGKVLGDIDFMNVPVISALGVKLFGEGTAYGFDEEKCDDVLSAVCKLVDEGKSVDEIVAAMAEQGVTLAKADAQEIATARGTSYARGIEHTAVITKGSTKKDIAALAIRMMASDDFAETFMEKANAMSPYTQDVQASSNYQFINSAKAIVSNPHFRAINGRVNGTRFKVLRGDYIFPETANPALTWFNRALNASYETAAEEFYTTSLAKAKALWEEYKK